MDAPPLVVVGAGACGMVAALAAAKRGVRVLVLEKGDHESDPEITRLLCEESGPLVEWLVDEAECEMICYTDFLYPGQSRHRMHGPKSSYGSELARQLEAAIRRDPRIELRMNARASGLLHDGYRVTGVETANGTFEAGA